ncbi:MAG: uroporphyrinogen decarboxylase family protein [Eubacteriales bacterium]
MNYENQETAPKNLIKERKQLFLDTVKQKKKPKRIPIVSNAFTWMICDSPYKLSEAIYDYDKMFEVICHHCEKYNFDLYSVSGLRNVLAYSDIFGKDCCYIINDDNYIINYPDSASIADEEDYPAFIEKGLVKYYFENGISRKYGLTDTENIIERFGHAAKEMVKMNTFGVKVKKQFNEVYGVPAWANIIPEFPCDTLFKAIRGMKGFSIDLRRNTYYLERALEVIDDHFFPLLKNSFANIGGSENVAFEGGRGISLVHTVLSRKQFEKYQWPYIKRYVDMVAEKNQICALFMEGSIDLLYDYLQDLPKGHVALQIEQEDPFEAKKRLPNVTIMGGFPTHYLGNESVEKCLDKAKELIDKMAYDGNFIFTSDKMLSFPNDARSENMIAINKFIKEYGVL